MEGYKNISGLEVIGDEIRYSFSTKENHRIRKVVIHRSKNEELYLATKLRLSQDVHEAKIEFQEILNSHKQYSHG